MYRLILLIILMMSVLLPFTAAAESGGSETIVSSAEYTRSGTVPKAALAMARQLDTQLQRRVNGTGFGPSSVSIAITVPVSLSNLGKSSALARQMAEEVTTLLVQQGYQVDDIRKGREIVMEEGVGEMLLTRDVSRLANRDVSTAAVLTGTYTVTADAVRFNLRLLHTPTNQVLASATSTVPVTTELFPLLAERSSGPPMPTVMTRLN